MCCEQRRLIELVHDSCLHSPVTEHDTAIVQYGLGLWLGCVVHKSSLLADLFAAAQAAQSGAASPGVVHGDVVSPFILDGLYCRAAATVSVSVSVG